MTAIEIINAWLSYTKYDPDKTTFNLMSNDYKLHRCNENIGKLSDYDPTGTLSVLYAKKIFLDVVKDGRVKLYELLTNPDYIAEERQMWDIFHSPDVNAVENELLENVNKLVEQIAEKKMIGERNAEAERESLFDSVAAVCEELAKCNEDLFVRGGEIKPVTRFSTHIHVFEYLAECLLALEESPDGMYLCYINNGGSADGYFGFYIKSNGNILSINERVNEAYPGAHKRSRNGRWTEDKKFGLFPYSYIFSFSEYDYKGYAAKHMIEEDKLAFFNLSPGAYMPLILAMIMLNSKYGNMDVSAMQLKYVDSLLPINVNNPLPETQALIVPTGSALARVNASLNIEMTSEGVKMAEYAKKYDYSQTKGTGVHYSEVGCFPSGENIFVQLYGDDFVLDTASLLEANSHLKRLTAATGSSDVLPNYEFVGSERRMGKIAYKQAREQLAAHIRKKMYEEFTSFGGADAVQEWWKKRLKEKRDILLKFCVDKYEAEQKGEGSDEGALSCINIVTECKGVVYDNLKSFSCPMNPSHGFDRHGRPDGKCKCLLTGNMASVFFTFTFKNWMELESVIGEEVPKILKGWSSGGHQVSGNSILDATDAVWGIGTPFERGEQTKNRKYWTKSDWSSHYFQHSSEYPDWMTKKPPADALDKYPYVNFNFAIGFSKRGLAQFTKRNEKGETK